MNYLLGYDIGTSSVKASLVDVETGVIVAATQYPDGEATISAPNPGWAEQDPQMWWNELVQATRRLTEKGATPQQLRNVEAIGISYQMHGLVCVDVEHKVLRPSIIWCDSRASKYGGTQYGNFTAAKLAWVKHEEPRIYERIHKIMLPGDYIAMRLSGGEITTTSSGLSEGMFWDLEHDCLDEKTMQYFGFSDNFIPEIKPTMSIQCHVCREVSNLLGIPEGTPISYRAGDQPNNALSLNVVRPGEIAATGGTSGVVYGVATKVIKDAKNRVNIFKHVEHLGVLLCINGTGILNAWIKRNVAPAGLNYPQMNALADEIPIGSEGLSIIPFGNGAERILENREVGCSIHGLNFNIHDRRHLLRAAQEGIVFSFAYGIEIMRQMGLEIKTIKAGHANMFLNPMFRRTLASVTGVTIQLYDTDGAAGAARGAGIGAGIYRDYDEAFRTLRVVGIEKPDNEHLTDYMAAYERWMRVLELNCQ